MGKKKDELLEWYEDEKDAPLAMFGPTADEPNTDERGSNTKMEIEIRPKEDDEQEKDQDNDQEKDSEENQEDIDNIEMRSNISKAKEYVKAIASRLEAFSEKTPDNLSKIKNEVKVLTSKVNEIISNVK